MSRSLGLREDRQLREVLVMQIAGLFPRDPLRSYRGQAMLPQPLLPQEMLLQSLLPRIAPDLGEQNLWEQGLPAMRPDRSVQY